MAVLRKNFCAGLLSGGNLTNVATSITDTNIALLPTVAAPDYLKLTLDPLGIGGASEVVHVTAHTAASTTATIARAKEGTSARAHTASNFASVVTSPAWRHAPTAYDFTLLKCSKVNALEYITGDGSTDDTTAWGYLATDAAGKTITGLGGLTSKVTGAGVVLQPNTTLEGDDTTIFNTTAAATVITADSGCHVKNIEAYGNHAADHSTVDTAGVVLKIAGTVGAYKSTIYIEDCYFHDAKGYLLKADFAERVWVKNLRGYNAGYCGVGCSSIDQFHVTDPIIDMNNPVGSASNAYGIFFSRTQGALVDYPRSTNFTVKGGTILNVDIWEGLDTHGGQYGSFIGTTVVGCAQAVAVGPSKDGGGTETFAAKHITVDVVSESFSTTGTANSGVTVAGAAGGEQAEGITIRGAYKGYGVEGTTTNGGIDCRDTIGLRIDATTINCSPNAVILRGNNAGFRIDLTAIDSWSTAATGRALWLNGTNNAGSLTSLQVVRGSKTATSVNGEGIRIDNSAGNALAVVGGLYNTATTPVVDAGHKSYSTNFAHKWSAFGHAESAQVTTPVTLGDVIALLQAYGLTP